jgi:hypothetical protein
VSKTGVPNKCFDASGLDGGSGSGEWGISLNPLATLHGKTQQNDSVERGLRAYTMEMSQLSVRGGYRQF